MKIQNINCTHFPYYNFKKQNNTKQAPDLKNAQEYTFAQTQALKNLVFTGRKYKKTIKRFVADGLLNGQILSTPDYKSRLNEYAKKDLFDLVSAKEKGKDIYNVFVPEFKSKRKAIDLLDVGDVCKIKDKEHIFIKTDSSDLKELGLSKEKYMELFPPIERFSAIQNGDIGDCWLLSACDSLYSNKYLRPRFLSIFKENENGGIDINFGGFEAKDGTFCPSDINQATYENADEYTDKRAFGPRGFACVEEAVEQMREKSAFERIKRTFDYFQENKDKKDEINFENTLYKKDEIEKFMDIASPCIEIPFMTKRILIDLSKKNSDIRLNEQNIKSYFKYFETDEAKAKFLTNEIAAIKRILENNLEKIRREKTDEVLLSDIMQTKIFLKFLFMHKNLNIPNEYISFFLDSPYIFGGEPCEIYKLFGMQTEHVPAKEAEEKLQNSDKNTVIVGDTDKKDKDYLGLGYKIYSNHAYLITPIIVKGERKYSVRNPHNSSQEFILSKDNLLKRFSSFTFAKIQEK